MEKQNCSLSAFSEVLGHIKQIQEWEESIGSKELDIARTMAADLRAKLKTILSKNALGVLALRVSVEEKYPFLENEQFTLLEYLCFVAYLQYSTREEDGPKPHYMEVIIPWKNETDINKPNLKQKMGIYELNDINLFDLKMRFILTSATNRKTFKISLIGCYMFNQSL